MPWLPRLTAKNQNELFNADIERMLEGRAMDYSIGQHIQLLIQRMDALEAGAKHIAQPLVTKGETNHD